MVRVTYLCAVRFLELTSHVVQKVPQRLQVSVLVVSRYCDVGESAHSGDDEELISAAAAQHPIRSLILAPVLVFK